jgi:uncharacterized membrane protein YccC
LVWSNLIDLLFPPDPGALRLLAAVRATLAAVLTFFLVMLLGTVAAVPVSDRILGFAIALFITANVRDATPRARLITIAIAPFVAFATTSLAALLLEQKFLAAAVVPPMMFAIAYGAARSPRYASLGIVGLIAYFVGLVTQQPPDTLPLRFVVLVLAAGDAALIRCVLLPERPQAELERLRRAIRAGMDRVLSRIGAAVEAGAWTDTARTALRRETYRLGDIVMMAQARIAALGTQLPEQGSRWLHLLTIELATERSARFALRSLGAPSDRAELLTTLQAVRNGSTVPPQQSTAPLASALGLLAHVLSEAPQAAPPPAAAPPPTTTAPGLRPSIQTAIAAALAIISGELVSPSRWYWAAFAAYVMFQGTRSRGESIAKGVQFMIGTVAGVVIGALAATLLSGHTLLTVVAIIIAVFLAFQANLAAYGVMIFWITIILGLLFGMLGYFAPEFLLLRLQETAAGAMCGLIVASFVLVRREYAATYDATIAFLRALGQSVDSAARVLLDHVPEPELSARVLATEQRFRDLSAIAQSEQSSHPLSRNEALRRRVLLLEACEQWARELGQLCLQRIELRDAAMMRSVRETVTRIDASLTSLINALANQPMAGSTEREPAESLAPFTQHDPRELAVRLLLRIDAALLLLVGRQ